ncbi:hypothetical protein [Kordia jejudonensis]|uniref:hypothetical protein n=1 Tax=Kordia jejudonensis TaxID=1348245 RepID=UPI000629BF41|nr:hypothetical protein [Kordia jejudonensis]
MKKLVLVLLLCIFSACATKKDQNIVLIAAIHKEIINAELQKDSTLAVLDTSRNNTYLDFPEFTSFFGDKDTTIQLSKNILKGIKVYSSDSLTAFAKKSSKGKNKLSDFLPTYNGEILLYLSIPFGNKDKSSVICEASILNPTNESFVSRFYSLQKTETGYTIRNIRTLDSTGKVVE